jgi:AcrR family transcriptional regulator
MVSRLGGGEWNETIRRDCGRLEPIPGPRVSGTGVEFTLVGMGRNRTITDEAILAAAREVFGRHGHTASTRQIAESAGISEAVLYQRFGSKEELFFASLRTTGPDVNALLGPPEPAGDPHEYLRGVAVRVGRHLADVIPLALRMMTHPAFDPTHPGRTQPVASQALREELAVRLAGYVRRGQIEGDAGVAARVVLSLAHDWALGVALAGDGAAGREQQLIEMIDVLWKGLRPG